jgi:predicted kinase
MAVKRSRDKLPQLISSAYHLLLLYMQLQLSQERCEVRNWGEKQAGKNQVKKR